MDSLDDKHIDATVQIVEQLVSMWKVLDTTNKNVQGIIDVYKLNQKDLDQTFDKIMKCITMHNEYITTLANGIEALAERVKVIENKPAIKKTPLN